MRPTSDLLRLLLVDDYAAVAALTHIGNLGVNPRIG